MILEAALLNLVKQATDNCSALSSQRQHALRQAHQVLPASPPGMCCNLWCADDARERGFQLMRTHAHANSPWHYPETGGARRRPCKRGG